MLHIIKETFHFNNFQLKICACILVWVLSRYLNKIGVSEGKNSTHTSFTGLFSGKFIFYRHMSILFLSHFTYAPLHKRRHNYNRTHMHNMFVVVRFSFSPYPIIWDFYDLFFVVFVDIFVCMCAQHKLRNALTSWFI